MDLNVPFIVSVITVYDELIQNGISLVYIGKFNQQVTKLFTAISENEMEENAEVRSIKRKVFHSMVELLQNMAKHSEYEATNYKMTKGLFMLGKKDDVYYLITANKIAKKDAPALTEQLERVNNATKEELKQMYKKQLKEGTLSERGGAGLGFIDIVRKTGQKIEYVYLPLDEENNFIVLKIEVNANHTDHNFHFE